MQALSEHFSCRRCLGDKIRKSKFDISGFKKRRSPGTPATIWHYDLLCPNCPEDNWRREDHAKKYRCQKCCAEGRVALVEKYLT